MAQPAPFIFEHIPKTAGTTFNLSYLAAAFPSEEIIIVPGYARQNREGLDNLIARPLSERLRLKMIAGHNTGLLRPHFPAARWLTLVRDPVERVISSYLHSRFHVDTRETRGKEIESSKLSVAQYVEQDWLRARTTEHSSVQDLQARVLLGPTFDWTEIHDRTRLKSLIQSRYHLVGYTEAFELFLFLLHVTEGFPLVLFNNRLVRKERATFRPTAGDLATIAHYNQADRVMYECVREEFDRRIREIWTAGRAGLYDRYVKALRAFQRANETNMNATSLYVDTGSQRHSPAGRKGEPMPNYLEGLSEYQREYLDSYPPTQVFAVISWGCAATSWIARVLSSHPDIYCVHSANNFWHVLGGGEKLDGVSYMRLIASQGYAHAAAGDVHGVGRHHVPELRRVFGRLFNSAVIVREPISRLHSQLALYEKYEAVDRAENIWDLKYIDGVLERCGIKLLQDDRRSRFFVHAVNMLNAILDEKEAGKIYRSEDLTTNANSLSDFIVEITRGRVSPASEWLQAAIQQGRVNTHSPSGTPHQFNDWEVDVISKVVDARSWGLYGLLGYKSPDVVRLGSSQRSPLPGFSQGSDGQTANGIAKAVTADPPLPVFSPAQSYWNQRATLAGARDRILALSQAVNRRSDLSPFQWAQLMAAAIDFAPDLILELGRGKGNSTCAFTEASNLSGGRSRVLSLCLSDDWERDTLPRLRSIVPRGWFQPLEALRSDILEFNYEKALAGAKRVLIFWDAHGFDIAECVLGRILPIVARLEHLVIMHDLSDTRYSSEGQLEYGGNGLWRGNDWSGPRLKLGIIDSVVEQSVAALDFTTRNHITLDSADHSFHTALTAAQQAEMRQALGELFETQAHWFYFSLNERPGPYKFPQCTHRGAVAHAGKPRR